MATKRLFDVPPKPRAKPRKLMHVIDAGPGIEDRDAVRLGCRKCGYKTGWRYMLMWQAKRGVPCPKCNDPETKEPS